MKKTAFILALITFLLAITSTVMIACDNSNEINTETVDDSEIVDTHTIPGFVDDGIVEDELPPESFVGKVIEEDSYYMVVEPNTDEEELKKYDDRDKKAAYIYTLMNTGYSYAEKTIKNIIIIRTALCRPFTDEHYQCIDIWRY